MHFKDTPQEREHRVTQALGRPGPIHDSLIRALCIDRPYWISVEFDKTKYQRIGDVDLALVLRPGTRWEQLYAIEVKVMQLRHDGTFQSEKKGKHEKQLKLLEDEGWHRVFLLDVIVTQPAPDWWHPQATQGLRNFTKEVVNERSGHLVMQINSVAHKPETDAGSVCCELIKPARYRRENCDVRKKIKEALCVQREQRE